MKRFGFDINVSVAGTRHQTQMIADSLIEALEQWSIEQADVIAKADGMTLEMTTVKPVKQEVS